MTPFYMIQEDVFVIFWWIIGYKVYDSSLQLRTHFKHHCFKDLLVFYILGESQKWWWKFDLFENNECFLYFPKEFSWVIDLLSAASHVPWNWAYVIWNLEFRVSVFCVYFEIADNSTAMVSSCHILKIWSKKFKACYFHRIINYFYFQCVIVVELRKLLIRKRILTWKVSYFAKFLQIWIKFIFSNWSSLIVLHCMHVFERVRFVYHFPAQDILRLQRDHFKS